MLTIQRQTTSSVEDVFGAAGTSGSGLYLDAGGALKVDGSTIGTYTNAAGVLTLSFNAGATQTLADKAVQGVTYRNSNSTPNYASVTLSFTLDDQNTNITNGGSAGTATGAQDQGAGGKLVASADIQIFMNHPPTAANDTATVLEGLGTFSVSTVSGNVVTDSGSGQDSDQDNDSLTVQGVVAGDQHGSTLSNAAVGAGVTGSYGSLNIGSGGAFTYTLDNTLAAIQALGANAHPSGNEVFTYTINDGKGGTSTATVTFTITGTNDAPLAAADTASAVEAGGAANATPGSNPTGDVLTNDTDPDTGDTRAVTAVSGSAAGVVGGATAGAYGTLTLNADGNYGYRVDNNAAAVQALRQSGDTLSDSFSYTISDSAGATSTATLTVSIHGANDTPLAVADAGTVRQGDTLTASAATGVLANDTDVDGSGYGETRVVAESSRGSFSSSYGRLTLNVDGSYAYVADGAASKALWWGDTATDAFTYTMQDAAGASSSATLSFTVVGVSVPVPPAPPPTIPAVDPTIGLPGVNPGSLPGLTRFSGTADGIGAPGSAAQGSAVDAWAGMAALRMAISAGQTAAIAESFGGESRRLESTDRGFPVERGQGDTAKLTTVQDQQKGGERLFVLNGIENTSIEVGQEIDYRVPKDAFGHTNTAAIVQLEASLSDGSPLPEWLDFDPTSGTFSGRPPASARGVIDVKVTARDDKGREVSFSFRVQINGKSEQTPAEPLRPGPGVDRGEQNLPDDMIIRVAAEKLPPAKRGTVPFSDQLTLSKRDPLVERILSRQYADMRAGHTHRLPG
jgi:VCBS repeat-containing protein